jgi:5S rRNA maturation endonuclease (ribonuclease M5)
VKQKIQNHFNGNYQAFYSKYLQKLKKNGGGEYQAICTFHHDTQPSFCFNNDTGVYFCQGCGKKGDIFHFYAKLHSLNTRSDFNKVLKGIATDFGIAFEQTKRRTVARYVYTDADGKPLHRTCRTEPKDFYQQHYDNGYWKKGLKGIEPVLYRLPEVAKAKEVCICEGEKDADNLAKLGFVATTCASNKWLDSYTQYLKSKDIVLIPDNDNAGRQHMARIASSLDGKVSSLKLLEIHGLPSKGDVSDFIASFNDDKEAVAERLALMIENAKPYQPPKTYSIEDAILSSIQFCELEINKRKCFLYPWLPENSLILACGWRGIGKSFFAKGIVNAVSRGESFGPWNNEVSVPCLFLDGEMALQDMMERSFHLGLNSERPSPLYIYSDALANQYGLPRAHLNNESWRTKMKSILIARKIKLWVVDNLASLASGLDENSKKDWDPINQWLLELRFAGISTIMLHHTNKEGGQRGTSAREDNIDASMLLKPPHDYVPEDGARFIVHFSKARVPTSDLNLIADTEFKLIEDETGKYTWTHNNVKAERKIEVLKMLDEGFDQNTIAEALGITKGRVSQIKKKAAKDGWITAKGNLTQNGFLNIYKAQKN